MQPLIPALVLLVLVAPAIASPAVTIDRAATSRICQVTGEIDRSTGRPTINATESRFRFWGTDLGASFEYDGKMVFLFGDTHPAPGFERQRDRDILALSGDTDPEDCLTLDVLTDDDGGYRPLTIPGVGGGPFSVPTGGFSANGAMYVVATTDGNPATPMSRSVLARSTDHGRTFQSAYDLSTDRFITVATAQHDGAVLLWGSGAYRRSTVSFAMIPEGRADDRSAIRYFAGLDGSGEPRWSENEQDSVPLIDQQCVGELSVAWNPDLAKWVMLYNCGQTQSRILLRTAERPWGPYSPPQVLFDAAADNGFCRFMNAAGCEALADSHAPQVAGDPYAPYQIARFAKGVKGEYSDIYFLMSTWNPYNVVLMKARLLVEPPRA
jgi:hypothetical protein